MWLRREELYLIWQVVYDEPYSCGVRFDNIVCTIGDPIIVELQESYSLVMSKAIHHESTFREIVMNGVRSRVEMWHFVSSSTSPFLGQLVLHPEQRSWTPTAPSPCRRTDLVMGEYISQINGTESQALTAEATRTGTSPRYLRIKSQTKKKVSS